MTLPADVPMRTLQAPGLTLEPQVAAHATELYAVLCDPAIYTYEDKPPASVDALRERLTRLETRRSGDGSELWLNWVLRLPEGAVVGFVQASVRERGHAAIAYVLGSAWWGRGLARRAVDAMVAELQAHHGVTRLAAVALRRNERSTRLLERLGFSLASPELHQRLDIPPEEVLMCRDLQP